MKNAYGNWSEYQLRHVPEHFCDVEDWEGLEQLLLDFEFLEAKSEAGMVDLIPEDFRMAIRRIPPEEARHKLIKLIEEALRGDITFLRAHPDRLLQCLWNSCWWFDCPRAALHYEVSNEAYVIRPWGEKGPRLYKLLEEWRVVKEALSPGFAWLRSLRPPRTPLGNTTTAVIRGQGRDVEVVGFSPDGSRVASGSIDGGTVWDIRSGIPLARLFWGQHYIEAVAWSCDGTLIAVGLWDKTARIYDAENGVQLGCLAGHTGRVESVQFSADGALLVTGGEDNSVRIWDVASGEMRSAFINVIQFKYQIGLAAKVSSVTFSPDAQYVAIGGRDHTVRIWERASGKEVLCLRGHEDYVTSITWSNDGHSVLSGSQDGTVRLWRLWDGEEMRRFEVGRFVEQNVAFLASGSRILAASVKDVRIWDSESGELVTCFRDFEVDTRCVVADPTGERIATGSGDGAVRIKELATGSHSSKLRGHKDRITGLQFTPSGTRLLTWGCDNTLRVWDAERGLEIGCIPTSNEQVKSGIISPNGRRAAGGDSSGNIELWDTKTMRHLPPLRGHRYGISGLAFTPDSRCLVSCSLDETIRIWDLETSQEIALLRGHTKSISGIDIDPAGRRIVSSAYDATVRVWDILTGQELLCIQGHKFAVMAAWFEADGTRIVSQDFDNVQVTFDAATGAVVDVLRDFHLVEEDKRNAPEWDQQGVETKLCLKQSGVDVTLPFSPNFRDNHDPVKRPLSWSWAGPIAEYLCLVRLEGDLSTLKKPPVD